MTSKGVRREKLSCGSFARFRAREVKPMSGSETRVLVVDDQRNIRVNLKIILEDAGYRVDATGDSEEALARCHRSRYDIAFLDINMPRIGGLELVRCIRVLSKTTTVVSLSQYGAITKVVEAMKLGDVDFVEKPIDPRKIQLLCDEILGRRASMTNDTVDELLHLAERALERNAPRKRASISNWRCSATAIVPSPTIGLVNYAKLEARSEKHCTIIAEPSMPARPSSPHAKPSVA